jgi:hypothetical protein
MLVDGRFDYLTRDNVETVTVEIARRLPRPGSDPNRAKVESANLSFAVPWAWHQAIRKAEKSPSGGQYLGAEVQWLLPVVRVPPKQQLHPGDVIIDKTGTRYTIQTANLIRNRADWDCATLDLVLAHNLRTQIWIETPEIDYNAAGAPVKLFPTGPPPNGGSVTYAAVPASVQLLSQEQKVERGIEGFQSNYDITIGREVLLTKEMRVRLIDGTYLDLSATPYTEPQRIDMLPVVHAELRVG